MAHFARLNADNIVEQVIVVNNEVITDSKGKEQEALGIAFCQSLFGEDTRWIQTSYNGSKRGKYAGIGDRYDAKADVFLSPVVIEKSPEAPALE